MYPSFEIKLEEREGIIKNISESSLKFTFGQDQCRKRDFVGQTQSRIAQNFPRLEIKFVFNNKSYLTTI